VIPDSPSGTNPTRPGSLSEGEENGKRLASQAFFRGNEGEIYHKTLIANYLKIITLAAFRQCPQILVITPSFLAQRGIRNQFRGVYHLHKLFTGSQTLGAASGVSIEIPPRFAQAKMTKSSQYISRHRVIFS